MPLPSAYLAGPDVFLSPPDKAAAMARKKVEICAAHGLIGLAPSDTDLDLTKYHRREDKALAIFRANLEMMLGADAIIANLTPFRGPSADAGTTFELGFFAGLRAMAEACGGRVPRIFAYSNSGRPFARRTLEHLDKVPDPLSLSIEDFGEMPDNLMLPCSVEEAEGIPIMVPTSGQELAFEDLTVFQRLVAVVAARMPGC